MPGITHPQISMATPDILGYGLILNTISWPLILLAIALALSPWIQVVHANGGISDASVRSAVAFVRRGCLLSSATEDDTPCGLIIGRNFLAYQMRISGQFRPCHDVWLIVPRGVSMTAKAETKTSASTVKTWNRSGPIFSILWSAATAPVSIAPTPEQAGVITQIIKHASVSADNGYGFNTSVLLHGPPGCGKSQIAFLLAKQLNAAVCTEHNPLDPGDALMSVVLRASATREAPLIVLLDEWDARISIVFAQPGAFRGKDSIPEIWDKTSYCIYMDKLCRYSNVIFIFTANSNPQSIANIDPSVVRAGRIDLTLEMCNVGAIEPLRAARFVAVAADAKKNI
jgi:ATPase family associated with various cellular activities (AAA)